MELDLVHSHCQLKEGRERWEEEVGVVLLVVACWRGSNYGGIEG